jgi:multiple sugar transport system substrate-binding protein
MRKILSKLLLIAVIVTMVAAVFFNVAASSDNKAAGTKTIKFIWWGAQNRHDITLKVIDMFQKKYPTIKVEPTYTSWDGYFEKINTLIAANETPDVMQQVTKAIKPYIDNNLLADFNKIKSIDNKDEAASIKNILVKDGKLYGAALGLIAPCLIYDKAMLAKAGVAAPTPKTTWSELLTSVKTLNQKLKIYGIANIAAENEFEVFVRERGESFISKDLKKVGFTEKTVIDFLKMCLDYEANGAEPVKVAIENRSNEENSTYAKGTSAMRFLWTNKIVSVYKTKKVVSEITVHPGPANENGTFTQPGSQLSIAEASKNKEEAGLFVSYFVNDIEANKVLKAERGVPAYTKVRNALAKDLDEQNAKIYKYIGFVAGFNKRPMDTNFAPAEIEVRRKYRDLSEAVMFKQVKPEDAAKQIISEANALLSK